MVYRKRGGHTWYVRVIACTGKERVCSTGTPLKTSADAVESWVKSLRARLDPHRILDAIVAEKHEVRRISLLEAYRLGEQGAHEELQRRVAAATDIDLKPMLAEFLRWRRQRAKGQTMIEKYENQITVLWPEAEWRRSQWTPHEHARRLDSLVDVKDATRNRYRSAVSAFSKYLVRRGLLLFNPIGQVEGYSESPAQEVWYAIEDAQRIMAALPDEFRIRELFMVGAGMDWTDCQKLRRRDITLRQHDGEELLEVRCHGSKTAHRNRVIFVTEKWAATQIKRLITTMLPDAFVCPRHRPVVALREHRRALKACGLPDSTLHNWRHHYAVTATRRREDPHVIAKQLGKANVKDVIDRYAKYTPVIGDYVATDDAGRAATNPATRTARGA